MRFASGEFYHIYNRGVEGRTIFMDSSDYQRFLKGLLFFNSEMPVEISTLPKNKEMRSPESPLVSIVSYVLMKNHIHLLIRCLNESSLSGFLKKIFIGYSMYFNAKYKRTGVLFQGRSKSKHITKDVYLKHLVNYIHLNPLDYIFTEWREQNVENIQRAKEVLFDYPWSSLKGTLEEKIDPILDYNTIKELFPNKEDLKLSLEEWLSAAHLENKDIFIEL